MELKPCPFCGGEAAIYTAKNGEFGMVFCKKCKVETPAFKGVNNAISAWNRRVQMEQREKLIELLYDIRRRKDLVDDDCIDDLADELIANGVVVLPEIVSVVEWHEVKTRPLDDEEKEYYAEMGMEPEYIFVGTMPDDGQEILVATKFGVDRDICCNDGEYGIGLEQNGDWDGVLAWAEMPTYAKRKGGDE